MCVCLCVCVWSLVSVVWGEIHDCCWWMISWHSYLKSGWPVRRTVYRQQRLTIITIFITSCSLVSLPLSLCSFLSSFLFCAFFYLLFSYLLSSVDWDKLCKQEAIHFGRGEGWGKIVHLVRVCFGLCVFAMVCAWARASGPAAAEWRAVLSVLSPPAGHEETCRDDPPGHWAVVCGVSADTHPGNAHTTLTWSHRQSVDLT